MDLYFGAFGVGLVDGAIVLNTNMSSLDNVTVPLADRLVPRVDSFMRARVKGQVSRGLHLLLPHLEFDFRSFMGESVSGLTSRFEERVSAVAAGVRRRLRAGRSLSGPSEGVKRLIGHLLQGVGCVRRNTRFSRRARSLVRRMLKEEVRSRTVVSVGGLSFASAFGSVLRCILRRDIEGSAGPVLERICGGLLSVRSLVMGCFVKFCAEGSDSVGACMCVS